jgi:chemotaxis signal transduction protein
MSVGLRRLLFVLGGLGFCLDLHELVEICEDVEVLTEPHLQDLERAVCGGMLFRRTTIPVVDLRSRLGLVVDPEARPPGNALILRSAEGNWALLVEKIEGFQPLAGMQDLDLPPMLVAQGWRCFRQIALHKSRPFIKLDLQACYGGLSP